MKYINELRLVQILLQNCYDLLLVFLDEEVQVGPFTVHVTGHDLEFWRTGEKDKKCVSMCFPPEGSYVHDASLVICEPQRRTVLTNFCPCVEEFYHEFGYPHIEMRFDASGVYTHHVIGDLVFARVDISGQEFVNYRKYEEDEEMTGRVKGNINNKKLPVNLPVCLKDGDKLLDVPIVLHVDMAQKIQEVMDLAEIEQFKQAMMNFSCA